MTDLEKKKEIWINPDKKHEYRQLRDNEWQFMLIQVNGSLSSILSYDSKEDAINDGWRLKNEYNNN